MIDPIITVYMITSASLFLYIFTLVCRLKQLLKTYSSEMDENYTYLSSLLDKKDEQLVSINKLCNAIFRSNVRNKENIKNQLELISIRIEKIENLEDISKNIKDLNEICNIIETKLEPKLELTTNPELEN